MLDVPQRCDLRNNQRGNCAQPLDDLSRFVEPPHMDEAGSEKAIRLSKTRMLLSREKKFRQSLIEAVADEMRRTDYKEGQADAGARAETQRCLDMCDRKIGLTGPEPEGAAQIPAAGKAWVECQSRGLSRMARSTSGMNSCIAPR